MDIPAAVQLPHAERAPLLAVARRVGFAAGLMVFVALVVVLGRDGYVDSTGDRIGFLDALYYASVTVTTTGYGDITAVSDGARAATILLITPARILFLILVVSTTVEVLTEQSRELLARRRWRKRVQNHTVICGYGATGQAAAADLLSRGVDPESIVMVDADPSVVEIANNEGFVAVVGDASHRDVLLKAAVPDAESVIVAPNRDDTAVLVTLTVRELNPDCHLVAGGREQENLHLLRQAGADEVIDATAAVGRMLGLGTRNPGAVRVLDDLLDAGAGLELVETAPVIVDGRAVTPEGANLVAVLRGGRRLPPSETRAERLEPDDRLVVLRESPVEG
ncbi:MAG: potassium channel family protein [Acidimicrobiales bacterium]|nr:potassium channel family protein [Acidimicrobiales bacterium]